MGTMKFALTMLKADFQKSLFYGGSLVFSTAVVFVFFNMTANPYYSGTTDMTKTNFSMILALIVVIIAMVLAFFANSYYLNSKTKELAIETICGGSVLTLANFLLTQNIVIMLFTIPLGLGLGYLLIPIINMILYPQMGVIANYWQVYSGGLGYTIVSLITEIIWLVIVDTGYAYRTEVKDLFEAEQTLQNKNKGIIRTPSIVFLAIYLLPIVLFLTLEVNSDLYLGVTVIGLFGISGMLNKVLPSLIMHLQKRYINHKHRLIALGNLHHTLKQLSILMMTIILSVTFLICFMCAYINDFSQLVIIFMSYVVLIILIAVSIVYKVLIEASKRKKSFTHMKMLGYVTADLKKIIAEELIGLFSVIILLPMAYAVLILQRFCTVGIVQSNFAMSIIGFYIAVILLSGILSYFLYTRLILKGGSR